MGRSVPDVERVLVDLLEPLLAIAEPTATVGVGVPRGWTVTSSPHVQISWDGTPREDWPIAAYCTVRVVVHAASTTEAKRIAREVHGLLADHDGYAPISRIDTLTGVFPATDSDTGAELASFTVRATVRTAVS